MAHLLRSPIYALYGLAVRAMPCKSCVVCFGNSQFHDTITKSNGNTISAPRPETTPQLDVATRKAGVRGIWITHYTGEHLFT